MCTYHTGDNHSGPCVLGAGGVVRMYYSNLAISVLVVCTYGANESTYDILAGSSSTATHQGIYFHHDGEIC